MPLSAALLTEGPFRVAGLLLHSQVHRGRRRLPVFVLLRAHRNTETQMRRPRAARWEAEETPDTNAQREAHLTLCRRRPLRFGAASSACRLQSSSSSISTSPRGGGDVAAAAAAPAVTPAAPCEVALRTRLQP